MQDLKVGDLHGGLTRAHQSQLECRVQACRLGYKRAWPGVEPQACGRLYRQTLRRSVIHHPVELEGSGTDDDAGVGTKEDDGGAEEDEGVGEKEEEEGAGEDDGGAEEDDGGAEEDDGVGEKEEEEGAEEEKDGDEGAGEDTDEGDEGGDGLHREAEADVHDRLAARKNTRRMSTVCCCTRLRNNVVLSSCLLTA
ncbi:hypothetical protein SPI_03338 [Niveomyces insectorum RCEF 264]|uniref:Uncharacterized protein n=1 Tax=Niveomyces insectorum RCEF 264 TaxID=1081102 RepID=A0A167X9F1_9HYPO|nr:hypothetical protein SPI_03338 [Niveomyces insectorum RCEF 264]